jgi:outer membrane protein assembly factor BamD
MRKLVLWLVALVFVALAFPPNCPAPLVWRPGEGWVYEKGGATTAKTPQEQLELGKLFQSQKDYDSAISAYQRLIRHWPTAYATQEGRLHLGECLSALGFHYKAFLEYQNLIQKHPNSEFLDTALQREFEIGNLFLSGEKHKVWRLKIFSGNEKAIEIFEQIIKTAPFGKLGADAQLRLGMAYEQLKEYPEAVTAYEKLVERYPQDPLAETAQFAIGAAYEKQAGSADYDATAANKAITAFQDYLIRYPRSERVPDVEKQLVNLKQEQGKGLFHVGEFYEKQGNIKAAVIYYNEVIAGNPKSSWGVAAQQKVAQLTPTPVAPSATTTPAPSEPATNP